jgi:hypothetical protein
MQTPGEFAENLVTQPCNKNNAAPADICKIDRFKTLPYERRSREKIQKYLIDCALSFMFLVTHESLTDSMKSVIR